MLEVAQRQLSQEQSRSVREDDKTIKLELRLGDAEYKLEITNRSFDPDPRYFKRDHLGHPGQKGEETSGLITRMRSPQHHLQQANNRSEATQDT